MRTIGQKTVSQMYLLHLHSVGVAVDCNGHKAHFHEFNSLQMFDKLIRIKRE